MRLKWIKHFPKCAATHCFWSSTFLGRSSHSGRTITWLQRTQQPSLEATQQQQAEGCVNQSHCSAHSFAPLTCRLFTRKCTRGHWDLRQPQGFPALLFLTFFPPTHTDLYHLYFIISKWHISSLINNQEDAINQNLSIITCARGKFSFPAGINWKFLPCKWEGRPSKRNICQQVICCSTTLHPFCCHSQSFLNVQVGHL